MLSVQSAGTFKLGDFAVNRLGYGAMQLAGPGVFGPPKNREAALAVLREAIESGVNHLDTSDFYGPHVTNQLIREALHPYRDNLVIVTKLGARRDVHEPAEGSIEAPLSVLAKLQRQGLVRHVDLSNVTPTQIEEGRRICEIVCVQNHYNIAHRADDGLIDDLARRGIAYVPYFPLGGFTPLQSSTLSAVAVSLDSTPMQVALAWLLRRAPNILLIPGTSSVAHLRENLAAAALDLSDDVMAKLDQLGNASAARQE